MPIAVTIRYEKPVYLAGYTKEFMTAYRNEINTVVPQYSEKFTEEFRKVYETEPSSQLKERKLGPMYTGSTSRSIGTETTKVTQSTSSQSILRVGYLSSKFKGRMESYVPSIEAGWGSVGSSALKGAKSSKFKSDQGHRTPKGDDVSKKTQVGDYYSRNKGQLNRMKDHYFPEYTDKKGNRKHITVTVPETKFYSATKYIKKRGFNKESISSYGKDENHGKSDYDKRIEKWARERLGITTSKKKRGGSKISDAQRLFLLKRSIAAGSQGREILPAFAQSGAVQRLWDSINNKVYKGLGNKFSGLPKKEAFTKSFVGRGFK